jgi:hypothetical protein
MHIESRVRGLAPAFAAAALLNAGPVMAEPAYRVSGPYTHENLNVYLVHGSGPTASRRLLTLDEAVTAGKVVVRETGNVGQLTIENVSSSEVFVQAGEIVKGGRQDRVLGTDLLLPARSGPVPIASHCVEQGRWQRRGDEPVDRFTASRLALSDKELKIANHSGSQGDVWSNVAKVQRQLQTNLGADVRAARSTSSLQLTLEDGRVRAKAQGYERALAGLIEAHPDAIGYAFAIGGELNSAEVYASRRLFAALWPKLLRASATEAVAAPPVAKSPAPGLDAVRGLLAAADGSLTEKAPSRNTVTHARETTSRLVIETREAGARDAWVHRSYLKKSPASR